jgi:hypothetical protein
MTINEDLIDDLLTRDFDDERIHQAARALAESDRKLSLYESFADLLGTIYAESSGLSPIESSGAGRLIETREQLVALPVATVVIEHDGAFAQAFELMEGDPIQWFYFGTDYYGSSDAFRLPARVVLLGTPA